LIQDPHFIAQHLEQAPHCALLFFPQESVLGKRYPSDAIIFDEAWSQSTMAVPVIGPDDFLSGTCNGLLCLYTKTSKIKIANLATGECILLDKPAKYLKGDHFSYYRFGFHPVTKEYKVIHFLAEHHRYSQATCNVIQVYTLGSEKWRDIRTSEALSLNCVKDYGVVSVDGAMFWLTENSGARWKHAVISFDLSEETFTQLQLPAAALESSKIRRYWITEIDGKLCIATCEVNRHRPRMLSGELQIWMLDSKVEQKWSQMYSLPYGRNYLPGPHFVHSDKILTQNRNGDLYSCELFGKNHEINTNDREKLLNFSPRKPDNMQSYICVKSLVQLDAYMNVSIVHETKQREGWELKKWHAWKREIHEVEDAWKNVYELEQNSLALPRHLGIVAKVVLRGLPDEVIRRRIAAEIDQILQHLPDCSDQHPRPLRRLNWVERKWDNEKLSARIDGVKDMAKASKQAHSDILRALSNVRDHLQGASSSAVNTSVE
jgi:F-box interacting protein